MAQTCSFEGRQYLPLAAAKLVFDGANAVTQTALGHVERLAQREYEAAVALLHECTAALEAEFPATDTDLEEVPTLQGAASRGPQGADESRKHELNLHLARKEKAAWRARALHAESRCAQLCAMLQARTLQTAASAALQLRGELLPAAVTLAEEATEATEQAPCARRQHTAKKSTGRPRGRPRKVQQVQQAAADALPTAGTGSQPSTPGG
ncbi:hypothetical protein ABPG77_006172 [Micractinium sp. CCAP 211/92]